MNTFVMCCWFICLCFSAIDLSLGSSLGGPDFMRVVLSGNKCWSQVQPDKAKHDKDGLLYRCFQKTLAAKIGKSQQYRVDNSTLPPQDDLCKIKISSYCSYVCVDMLICETRNKQLMAELTSSGGTKNADPRISSSVYFCFAGCNAMQKRDQMIAGCNVWKMN